MNPKHWLPWLCVVMLLLGEAFLFNANRQKNAAAAAAHDAQQQAALLQSQLDQSRLSSATETGNENDRLRRDNKNLSDKLAAAQNTIKQMAVTNALLVATNEQLMLALEMFAQQQSQMDTSTADAQRTECLNNLRQIDAAKQQWALENGRSASAIPTSVDLLPYLPNGFPVCPSGGRYTINAVSDLPTCSVPGHTLAQ